MDFLERDLEDIVHGTPQHLLRARGLKCCFYDKAYRQLKLSDYGIADLMTLSIYPSYKEGFKRRFHITIYELKQQMIDVGVLLQAAKYFAAARKIVEYYKEYYYFGNTEFTYSVVLIGRTLDTKSNFCYLMDLFENLSVYTYSYKVDGIQFDNKGGYHIPNCDMNGKAEELKEGLMSTFREYALMMQDTHEPAMQEPADVAVINELEELPF